jgi:streptogramin lyase
MRARFSAILAAAVVLAAVGADAQTRTWTTTADFSTGTLVNTSATRVPDALVLGPTAVSQTHVVWSTNYLYGYIVRMDSLTGKQTGRYDSALVTLNGAATGARPAQEYCDFASTGNCPGRVAVDANGDVWIINRAFGHQGTVTKFSGDVSHCIDRNNNGVIDTSFDKNGDGLIDVNPASGEYFGQNDECIITTIPVGPVNVWPRGVAVDKNGKVWVSTFNDGKVYRYNPNDPVALEATVTVGNNPYSLATGGDYLFVSNASGGGAKRVNVTTLAVNNLAACPGTYGVVADPGGSVAWLGGYFTGTGFYKADFAANTCTLINTGTQVTAMTLDLAGNVWAAGYNAATVHKVSPAGVLLGSYPSGGASPHGLSVDFQGNVWVVNDGSATMAKLNPNTGALIGNYTLGGPGVANPTPYLYSDFTGVQIDRQAPYARLGTWSNVFDGGAAKIPWSKLLWNAEAAGSIPAQTSAVFSVRASDTVAGLSASAYLPATNGAALSGVVGRYVQVQAKVSGPGFVTPTLSDVTVAGPCAGTPGPSCCVVDADCGDGNACTADTCPVPGGACKHAAVATCCLVKADCNDGDLCTDDTCPTAGSSCSFVRRANCCTTNADCADADPCTADLCSGPGGTCSHPTIAGCCKTNADCVGASACTVSTCPAPGALCKTTPKPGCCTSDKDCADSDACTADTCNVATGACTNVRATGCCNADGDCNDGKACTKDTCSGPGGSCQATAIAGCCNADGDCNDGNVCTKDTCSGAGGVCVATAIAGCCATDGDCDDGDACTTDTCPAAGGACVHTAKAACCHNTADCDDKDRCTKDVCPAAGGSCSHAPIESCCTTSADCAGGTCTSGWCAPTVDAGAPDVGPVDTGIDAEPDASAPVDTGVAPGALEGGGCGCVLPGGTSSTNGGLVGAAFATALLLGSRRRRRG